MRVSTDEGRAGSARLAIRCWRLCRRLPGTRLGWIGSGRWRDWTGIGWIAAGIGFIILSGSGLPGSRRKGFGIAARLVCAGRLYGLWVTGMGRSLCRRYPGLKSYLWR